MSRLKGRNVYSPCDEAGAVLLNRVGGRISPPKKRGKGGGMYGLHITCCKGKMRSKGLGEGRGEKQLEEGINPVQGVKQNDSSGV